MPIVQKHEVLKTPVSIEPVLKIKLSHLAGKLSHKTAEAMQKYVIESRGGWDERLNG